MATSPGEGATSTTPEAPANGAQRALDITKRAAKGLAGDVKSEFKSLSSEAKQQLESGAASRMGGIADGIEQLSTGLGEATAGLDESWAKPLANQATEALKSVAGYVRTSDAQSLMQDAQRFAKERPATTMLSAVAVGFALARAGKALLSQLPETQSSPSRSADA